jgi:CheY-like chemotaxis protein
VTERGFEPMESERESTIRILVVDDDEVYREILRDALLMDGVEIVMASDGVEGLEKLQDGLFDILISDLNMPRMDGLTLLKNARMRQPHLITVVVTGYGSLGSAIEAIRLGAYDYLQKPFKIEEMVVTARNAVEKVRFLREKAALVREVETLHQKLRMAEVMKGLKEEGNGGGGIESISEKTLFLSAQHSTPLWMLESPRDTLSGALIALDNLKELRRDGTINELEFMRLKKLILDKVETVKT